MVLHAKRYSLTLNRSKCVGCGVCIEICPREAIEVTRTPKAEGEEAKTPTVTISKEKCHYCGICEAICAFGALSMHIDGEHVVPVVESESFPQLNHEVTVDETMCGVECTEIEEPCPLGLITVTVHTKNGKEVKDAAARKDKKNLKVKIEVDKESCPGCRLCETKFPDGAVHVKKIFEGNLRVNSGKCPEGCHDCLDVCPIPGVLWLSEDGKVQVNEANCVYCGACRVACPEEGALELARTRIRHSEIRSGAWNRALEKIASTKAVMKELKSKSEKKLQQSVENRCISEVEDYV